MMPVVHKLASLKLTFVGLCWLVVHSATVSRWPAATPWLVLPLGLLSINLLAAILVNRVFRSQAALLVFHIGLLCVLVLAGAGILLRFEGNVEIVEGADFEPRAVNVRQQGWLHSSGLSGVKFTQGPIEVRYRSGLLRDTTHSSVEVDGRGPVEIGDRQGITARGYRFITTFNKGYSVLLMWEGEDGGRSMGAVNFPSYPDLEWKQVNDWATPGGATLRLELVLPERIPSDEAWTLRSRDADYRLAVSAAHAASREFEEGDVFDVPGGRVRVQDLRLWMGYRIDHNPVLPWLAAAAFLALGALAWHVQRKFAVRRGPAPVTTVGRRIEA